MIYVGTVHAAGNRLYVGHRLWSDRDNRSGLFAPLHSFSSCTETGMAVLGMVSRVSRFAFYKVVAAAIASVVASVLVNYLSPGSQFYQQMQDPTQLWAALPIVAVVLVTCIFAVFKVPQSPHPSLADSRLGCERDGAATFRRDFCRCTNLTAPTLERTFRWKRRPNIPKLRKPADATLSSTAIHSLQTPTQDRCTRHGSCRRSDGRSHAQGVQAACEHRPLIIRVDQVGHAEAIDYKNFNYKPQESEASIT